MSARVTPDGSGRWSVVDASGQEIAASLSNSQAWRLADRHNNEAKSRSEDVTDWVNKPN